MRKASISLKKAVCLILVAAFLASTLSLCAFALGDKYYGPKILGLSMDDTRSRFTITFDKELSSATSDLVGNIQFSQSGLALDSLPAGAKASISGFTLLITLPYSLDTADNFFKVKAGTLVNQTIDLETSLFDARGPSLAALNPVVANTAATGVTLKFKSAVKGYPNDDSLENGGILLARNGTVFSEVIPEKSIRFNNTRTELTIYFSEPLTDNNAKIKIVAGKLKNLNNGNVNINDIITPAIKISNSSSSSSSSNSSVSAVIPDIESTQISTDRRTVTIYFTSSIKNAYASGGSEALANSMIKSYIWVSRASNKNFERISASDSVTVASNYVKITFNTPLTENKNYIKIEKNTLTDSNDNYINKEYITDNVTADVPTYQAVPEFASVSLPNVYTAVLYFNIPVIRNSTLTNSQMLSLISVSRNGGSFKSLTTKDTVTFSENSMTIKFDSPLTESNNKIQIQVNAITSKIGTPLEAVVTTPSFEYKEASDVYVDSAPKYKSATYDKNTKKITIYFEKNIKLVTGKKLSENILISRNNTVFKSLSENDAATISPQNAISISLSEPLTGTKNAIKLPGGVIADYESGYVLNETVTSDYLSGDQAATDADNTQTPDSSDSTSAPVISGDATCISASVSEDFYTVTLSFDEAIYNNLSSLQELKPYIQVFRDGKFVSLTSDDYVRIDSSNNKLTLVLTTPVYDYFAQIKILPNALRKASGNALTKTFITAPLGEADGIARLYINDSALIGGVDTETSGNSLIATLNNESTVTSAPAGSTSLIKIPTSKSKVILNISSNVASSIKSKGSKIALSYGNTTYYIPSGNIPTLSDGDVLSLSIDNASVTSLSSAAAKDSFNVVNSSAKLSANVIDADGSSKAVSHTAFADKRFLVSSSDESSTYTAVRVENSGTIVPVPSEKADKNGFIYLTAKTLSDGNYAVISANHTFTNTPNWVQVPANTLGSHLILTNAAGSDLKASQPISRSETVSIMSRTLGILYDSKGASPFFDVVSTDNFFNSVLSAVSHKLISGYPDGTFKPKGTLTRAEAMTIVARAMRFMQGKSVSASSDMSLDEANAILAKFNDYKNVDNWAKIDIAECVEAGVVNGDNKGNLNPKANVTRAELIQLMYNILNKSNML